MPTPQLTAEIISAAIEGFESQKRRIDDQIAELRAMLPGGPTAATATPEAPTLKRRKFSADARRKMALAQKARWAKIRGESESPAPATPEPSKPKRRISEEGMKRIIAATKKRWALKRAEAAKAQPASAKKATGKKATPKKAPVTTAKKTSGKGSKKKATAPEQTAPAA